MMHKLTRIDNFLVALWGVACLATLLGSVVYFGVPYLGFTVSPATGEVRQVFVRTAQDVLIPGTKLTQVNLNSRKICSLENVWNCVWQRVVFEDEEIWSLTLESGQVILWTSTGFNVTEFLERLSGLWLGAVIFCWGGRMLIVKGLLESSLERLLLLQSSLWIFGLIGLAWMQRGIEIGGWLFAIMLWLLAPVYFQFHWMFPLPLGKLPNIFWVGLYGMFAFASMGVMWQQNLSKIWYLLPIFLMVSGNFLLLMAQWWYNVTCRSAVTRMGLTWLFGVPLIFAAWQVTMGEPFTAWEPLMLLVCITPMINLITLYRHSANPMAEQFVSHLSISTFTVIFFGVVSTILGMLQLYFQDIKLGPDSTGLMLTTIMVIAHWGYVRLDRLLRRFYLGIYEFPAKTLTEFGWAMATVNTAAEVTGVLRNYIFDPMRINKAVIFVHNGQQAQPLLQIDVTDDEYPSLEVVTRWLEIQYIPSPRDVHETWVRKVLGLRSNDRLVGLCCLGKRTPENLYYAAEIQPMVRLLNQAIMVWTNLELTRSLRTQIQNNLTLQEQQRLNLARDLHDRVLGELGLLRRAVPDANPEFIAAYNQAVSRIREIISGLRPNMLNYGLHTAFTELADDPVVQIQVENPVPIEVNVPQSAERYPEAVELQIYRIVQQACQNACRHAAPSRISIEGELLPGKIKLVVRDDGRGISEIRPGKPGNVPGERRFGVHGMYERAMLIGANLHIGRNPGGKGTQVMLEWHSEGAESKPVM